MENTSSNKERYFGAHWGCDYSYKNYSDYKVDKGAFPINETDYLHLTPLQMISDEDLSKVGEIYFETYNYTKFENTKLGNEFIESYINEDFEFGASIRIIHAIDFLRSRGYALPFHDLEVDELIEYGWLKLKTEK